MNKIFDVCIIGAGAAGIASAIESSRRGLSCVVVDKNKKPCMKLYATGNGRCNLTNDTWEEDTYYGNEFVDLVFDNLYNKTGLRQRSFIIDYMNRLGVRTVNKNGYIYPASLQASTVAWALTDAAKCYGTQFINRFEVKSISKNIPPQLEAFVNNSNASVYEIKGDVSANGETAESIIYARSLIITTGGLSQSKLGAATYDTQSSVLNALRAPIRDFKPGLCQVFVSTDLEAISGVRTACHVSVNGHSEAGELQITDNGLSGIVIFNMSYYINPGDDIKINLIPGVSEEAFLEFFTNTQKSFPDRSLVAFLNGYINDKLASYFTHKFYGDIPLKLRDVTTTGILGLYHELCSWELIVTSKAGFDNSQASIGGIVTKYINPDTMKLNSDVTIGDNIHVAGEVTDVIGKCGGYNLTYAFISGYLAGRSVLR